MIENTRKVMDISQKVVVPSEYYKNLVIQKYHVKDENIVVYPSAGINEKVFYVYSDEKKEKLRKEYDISDKTFTIGFVSRINKAKGWDVFIEAIERCDWIESENTRIFIVGSGEDDAELESRINCLSENVRNRIIKYPLLPQQKLAEIYNILDVFVFPTVSASESLGLVAIEAMACGVPVIASDYAAPAYYIIDGVNGYKFKLKDANELANRIQYMRVHPDKGLLINGAKETAKKYLSKNIRSTLKNIFLV